MRTDEEIDAAAALLRKALRRKSRWNERTRKTIEAQLQALEERMTIAQADRLWYEDETAEEYRDGDNDLFNEVEYTIRWMNGQKGYKAPDPQ